MTARGVDEHIELGPGQVDIWRIDLGAFQQPDRQQSYLALINQEERERYERFAFEPLRQNFLVAHAFTRIILARYVAASPAALQFTRNAYGRPELSQIQPGVRFNLSHTRDWAALAITTHWDIGVDIECDDHAIASLEIAARYFAPPEFAWLKSQPAGSRKTSFVQLWSLKEAFIKARGLGLSMDLDQFAVESADQQQPRLAFLAGTAETADEWRLYTFRPTAPCALSVAIRCGKRTEPDLAILDLASPDAVPCRVRPPVASWG